MQQIFEDVQGRAEYSLEELHQYAELELKKYLEGHGPSTGLNMLHDKLTRLTCRCFHCCCCCHKSYFCFFSKQDSLYTTFPYLLVPYEIINELEQSISELKTEMGAKGSPSLVPPPKTEDVKPEKGSA